MANSQEEREEPRKLGGLAAELIVAAQLVEYGWNIYSPHVDEGFDFIAVLPNGNGNVLMRPVQVRGRYPQVVKDETSYGKERMKLSQIHKEMVLAIPYFKEEDGLYKLVTVAFMPYLQLRPGGHDEKGNILYNSKPAHVKNGIISPRRDFKKFFDGPGIQIMAHPEWYDAKIG